jgi:hypothetical protein
MSFWTARPETRSGLGKKPSPDRLIELLVIDILIPLERRVNTYMDT